MYTAVNSFDDNSQRHGAPANRLPAAATVSIGRRFGWPAAAIALLAAVYTGIGSTLHAEPGPPSQPVPAAPAAADSKPADGSPGSGKPADPKAPDPKTPSPTTVPAPTTAPIPATAPLPSPRQIALALAAALDKSDANSAKSLVIPQGHSAKIVDATIALAQALRKLDAAAATRFPDAGQGISQGAMRFGEMLKGVEQGQEKIEGDSASLALPPPAGVLHLKKVGGKWLVDMTPPAAPSATPASIAKSADRLLKLYDLLAQAADQTTAEIAAGIYPTTQDAAAALTRRILRARLLAG